jgi:hypothetical protein
MMTKPAAHKSPAQQLDLFAGFALPEVLPSCPPKRTGRALVRKAGKVVQLAIDLRERAEDPEEWADRWVSRPIIKAVVPASLTRMPETRAVASVFDLGCQAAASHLIAGFMAPKPKQAKAKAKPDAIQDRIHTRVIRDGGVIRCERLHHTETEAWQEQETARRAKQKPPKPGAKYKTMGDKLKEVM